MPKIIESVVTAPEGRHVTLKRFLNRQGSQTPQAVIDKMKVNLPPVSGKDLKYGKDGEGFTVSWDTKKGKTWDSTPEEVVDRAIKEWRERQRQSKELKDILNQPTEKKPRYQGGPKQNVVPPALLPPKLSLKDKNYKPLYNQLKRFAGFMGSGPVGTDEKPPKQATSEFPLTLSPTPTAMPRPTIPKFVLPTPPELPKQVKIKVVGTGTSGSDSREQQQQDIENIDKEIREHFDAVQEAERIVGKLQEVDSQIAQCPEEEKYDLYISLTVDETGRELEWTVKSNNIGLREDFMKIAVQLKNAFIKTPPQTLSKILSEFLNTNTLVPLAHAAELDPESFIYTTEQLDQYIDSITPPELKRKTKLELDVKPDPTGLVYKPPISKEKQELNKNFFDRFDFSGSITFKEPEEIPELPMSYPDFKSDPQQDKIIQETIDAPNIEVPPMPEYMPSRKQYDLSNQEDVKQIEATKEQSEEALTKFKGMADKEVPKGQAKTDFLNTFSEYLQHIENMPFVLPDTHDILPAGTDTDLVLKKGDLEKILTRYRSAGDERVNIQIKNNREIIETLRLLVNRIGLPKGMGTRLKRLFDTFSEELEEFMPGDEDEECLLPLFFSLENANDEEAKHYAMDINMLNRFLKKDGVLFYAQGLAVDTLEQATDLLQRIRKFRSDNRLKELILTDRLFRPGFELRVKGIVVSKTAIRNIMQAYGLKNEHIVNKVEETFRHNFNKNVNIRYEEDHRARVRVMELLDRMASILDTNIRAFVATKSANDHVRPKFDEAIFRKEHYDNLVKGDKYGYIEDAFKILSETFKDEFSELSIMPYKLSGQDGKNIPPKRFSETFNNFLKMQQEIVKIKRKQITFIEKEIMPTIKHLFAGYTELKEPFIESLNLARDVNRKFEKLKNTISIYKKKQQEDNAQSAWKKVKADYDGTINEVKMINIERISKLLNTKYVPKLVLIKESIDELLRESISEIKDLVKKYGLENVYVDEGKGDAVAKQSVTDMLVAQLFKDELVTYVLKEAQYGEQRNKELINIIKKMSGESIRDLQDFQKTANSLITVVNDDFKKLNKKRSLLKNIQTLLTGVGAIGGYFLGGPQVGKVLGGLLGAGVGLLAGEGLGSVEEVKIGVDIPFGGGGREIAG